MTEYRKQAAFLKVLMNYDDSAEGHVLRDRLATAERNEKCLLAACWLVGLVAAFGLAGLGYSAVLLAQFFDSSTHVLIRVFGALGLGSGLCLLLFFGLWVWYRIGVNRIHEECRHVVQRALAVRLNPDATPLLQAIAQPVRVLELDPVTRIDNLITVDTRLPQLPKAAQ